MDFDRASPAHWRNYGHGDALRNRYLPDPCRTFDHHRGNQEGYDEATGNDSAGQIILFCFSLPESRYPVRYPWGRLAGSGRLIPCGGLWSDHSPIPDQTCANPGPYRAPIPYLPFCPPHKTPVNRFFSVRMENKPDNRPVCRNSPDFDVSYGPLTARESRIILTGTFTHPVPGKAEKTRI